MWDPGISLADLTRLSKCAIRVYCTLERLRGTAFFFCLFVVVGWVQGLTKEGAKGLGTHGKKGEGAKKAPGHTLQINDVWNHFLDLFFAKLV